MKGGEEEEDPRGGGYSASSGGGFLPLDKSQGKHPGFPTRPQIPVDADWTSSSAIFTVCRRIDLSTRGCPRPCLAWPARLCMHINRDNRGSPGAAYRTGGPRVAAESTSGDGSARRSPCKDEGSLAPPRGDLACKWSAFIVRKEPRMNM